MNYMYFPRGVESKCRDNIIHRVQFHRGFLRLILEIDFKVALIHERAKGPEIKRRKYESYCMTRRILFPP